VAACDVNESALSELPRVIHRMKADVSKEADVERTYRELLKELQASYNPEHPASEMGILGPVLETEILVIDDNPGDVRLIVEAFREGAVPQNLHTFTDGETAGKWGYFPTASATARRASTPIRCAR
jgi:hypothetical protein